MELPTEALGEEDTFRRATFNWAVYTKRMVESSRTLTPTTKVSPAALADIAHARNMLDELFVPRVTAAGEMVSQEAPLTAEDLQQTVDGVAERASVSVPAQRVPDDQARPGVRVIYASQDWSAPVWPKTSNAGPRMSPASDQCGSSMP